MSRGGSNHIPLLVTARLSSPIAHAPPHLDALLEWAIGMYVNHPDKEEPWKITRSRPAPPIGVLPIPISRVGICGWPVALCSSPVYATAAESVEHYVKKLATHEPMLVAESERKVVNTTGGWAKSYRLPLRVRTVPMVRWCCVGNRREILESLKLVTSLSKKRSYGYGRVERWEAEEADGDFSWFAPTPDGRRVLMRVLPAGDWMKDDLLGWRKDYAACCPPYWHPDRYTEVVAPC